MWTLENWETLWDNILEVKDFVYSGKPNEHFIGTIITKQRIAEFIGENKNDLIDGQQRLTTLALLLKAIADTSDGTLPKLKEKINELLKYEDTRGIQFLRIIHSKIDKEYFELIINNPQTLPVNTSNNLVNSYKYFIDKVKDMDDNQRDEIRNIILDKVPVISMLLSVEDDEQEIFDTINSLGVRLTTGELLKNFIFMEEELQPLYGKTWYEVYELDEDTIEFWNRIKTSGRVIRTNIELFLYSFLIIKTLKEVKLEKLFKEYKLWLRDKNPAEKSLFLEELKVSAQIYFGFPEGISLNEFKYTDSEKRFFHIIENFEITTIIPLILYLYKEVNDYEERLNILSILESYIVRRNVCKLTNKNYNKLFIQIIQTLETEKAIRAISASLLYEKLMEFTDDSNKYPTDNEFVDAFRNNQFSNSNAREILFNISLYQVNNELSDVKYLNSTTYTTEHMMPVKWEEYWNDETLSENQINVRNRTIKTLGNLTIVTGKLNSKMQNAKWEKKKEHLHKYSKLRITADYLDINTWNEESIAKRANELSEIALLIWGK